MTNQNKESSSGANMTAEELIGFLESRGKFIEEDAGFITEPDRLCQH